MTRTFGLSRIFAGIALAFSLLVPAACEFSPGPGGTEGEGLTGVLVDAGGNRLAQVKVRLFPKSLATLAKGQMAPPAADSVLTNAQGHFDFGSLGNGRYNLSASIVRGDSTLAVFVKNIHYDGDRKDLGIRTLVSTGGISLHVSDAPEGTECRVAASPFAATMDSSGHCVLRGLPPGSYRIEVSAPGYATAVSDEVTVAADIVSEGGSVEILPEDQQTVLYPTRDGFEDLEGLNRGLGSELRLMTAQAAAFLVFEGLPAAMAGRTLAKAELIVQGWAGGTPQSASLQLYSIPLSEDAAWKEGTGHWYYHAYGKQPNFDEVYAAFPQYVPPAAATDPAMPASDTASMRIASQVWSSAPPFSLDARWSGDLPGASIYPLLENTGKITFDITARVRSGTSRAFAIRLDPGVPAYLALYSRNHLHPAYSPRLVLTFE